MPVSATTCSLEAYLDYALWLIGSSFAVGEVIVCHVEETNTSHPLHDHAMAAFNTILVSAPIFLWARKAVSNNADLSAMLADPPSKKISTLQVLMSRISSR